MESNIRKERTVGAAVGATLGAVGEEEGASVGEAVGSGVSECVGAATGECVGKVGARDGGRVEGGGVVALIGLRPQQQWFPVDSTAGRSDRGG